MDDHDHDHDHDHNHLAARSTDAQVAAVAVRDAGSAPTPTRRRALMLGAAGTAAVLSIRPALAQTHASVLTCDIPVPDAARAGSYVVADGTTVPAATAGAFAPPGHALKGEEVRQALTSDGTLPDVEYQRSQAYMNYIRRLQRGTGGFTCFDSLQMPRG